MILVPAHRECTRDFRFELNLFSVVCLVWMTLEIYIFSISYLRQSASKIDFIFRVSRHKQPAP
jgi:hypothetical protein